MEQMKRKYEVFLCTIQSRFGQKVSETRESLGVTWAVSKAKAENNMRFRSKYTKANLHCADDHGYERISRFEAVEI